MRKRMLEADDVISLCKEYGYSFFTGVPCSFLQPLINCAIERSDIGYIAACSEGEAVGIASGAYLAGSRAVVVCQNSGFGNMINPLTSLNFPFRIPVLLFITLRGEAALQDEPQHELMGKITGNLLDTLLIRWRFFPVDIEQAEEAIDSAGKEMADTGLPFSFIMRKGTVAKKELRSRNKHISDVRKAEPKGRFIRKSGERMARMEAITIVREIMSEKDALIATTGKIGRELFTLGDRENQLYVVGSMGCASGIGFGIQRVRPKQGVVILDGDGAALMKMGTIATIGHYQPSRFIHIILDNESHDSTGGQPTVSSTVDFCRIASGCGYRQCYRADTDITLAKAINSVREVLGPTLIHVKVARGSALDLGRPTVKPIHVKERFMRFLQSNTNQNNATVLMGT